MKIRKIIIAFLTASIALSGCTSVEQPGKVEEQEASYLLENSDDGDNSGEQSGINGLHDITPEGFDLSAIPKFDGRTPYVAVNDNQPFFTDSELTTDVFENYSDLDALGRCGVAYANICKELMPTEKRQEIGQIKPSGWHTVKYDNVDGKYLYNRCHLIGFQLAGENANEKNLITGTRYMNVDGMLPFENLVADFAKETDYHVLYRVTPIYETDQDLVARGVLMEAKSVEDGGSGVEFCVFCYNNQPGIKIDYKNGESWESSDSDNGTGTSAIDETYILNTKTMKFHRPSCDSVEKMNESNKKEVTEDREKIVEQGYTACKICNP